MTKRKRCKRFSPEFKREALKRASEEGVTDAGVCEELGVTTRQQFQPELSGLVLVPDVNVATSARLYLWQATNAMGNLLNLFPRLEEGFDLLVDAIVGFCDVSLLLRRVRGSSTVSPWLVLGFHITGGQHIIVFVSHWCSLQGNSRQTDDPATEVA